MIKKEDKKAAIELSVGTIVIIVIAVTMLILGIVFVRSIMCSGIQITENLDEGVKNEINDLFGADEIGVNCMGEGGQEISIGTGGRRPIACIIKTEEQKEYDLRADIEESLKGASKSIVEKEWVLDQDWRGTVSPGKDQEAVVMLLDIPRDAPTTTLKIRIKSTDITTGKETTHISYIDIVPVGFFRTTMC
jgi:hypothetical protein